VDDELVRQEAQRLGISTAVLLQREVDDKVEKVSAKEAHTIMEFDRSRLEGLTEDDATKQIIERVERQRRNRQFSEFLEFLRGKAKVVVYVTPPRTNEDLAVGPSIGLDGAPIRIVLFSDFECPYCGEASRTVKKLIAQYEQEIRITFRHFPLPIHRGAEELARAAVCADKQGVFWQFHDELFDLHPSVGPTALMGILTKLRLDTRGFSECVVSKESFIKVYQDRQAGNRNGVTGTPTFFINGRMQVGASFEGVSRVIDEEIGSIRKSVEACQGDSSDQRDRVEGSSNGSKRP